MCEPCAGISAWKSICDELGMEWCGNHVYEIDPALGRFWRRRLQENKNDHQRQIQLDEKGDITVLSIEGLTGDVEAIVSGPPCQPWSPSGKQLGEYDERSVVFLQVQSMICHYAHRGSLLFFLIENSSRLAKTAFLREALEYFRAAIPWFVVDYVVQDLRSMFPHSRTRVWIRGLRRDCCPSGEIRKTFPDPWLPARVQKPTLRSFLFSQLPNTDP